MRSLRVLLFLEMTLSSEGYNQILHGYYKFMGCWVVEVAFFCCGNCGMKIKKMMKKKMMMMMMKMMMMMTIIRTMTYIYIYY